MRVSCTTLESFRLFMEPETDWMNEAALIATIRGDVVDTPAMALGRAFESVLMDPDAHRVPHGFQCGDYAFSEATMAPALAVVDRSGLFQVKAQKAYGAVDVVAKADQIVGAHIIEWKTTTASFSIEKYLDSVQFRYMLDIFEAALVTYHVFCLDDHGNGVVEVKGIESFNLFPYPALHQDCAALVRTFAAYLTGKGLDGLLRQRQVAAA